MHTIPADRRIRPFVPPVAPWSRGLSPVGCLQRWNVDDRETGRAQTHHGLSVVTTALSRRRHENPRISAGSFQPQFGDDTVADKKADLAGPGIGDYDELAKILPSDYTSLLD